MPDAAKDNFLKACVVNSSANIVLSFFSNGSIPPKTDQPPILPFYASPIAAELTLLATDSNKMWFIVFLSHPQEKE